MLRDAEDAVRGRDGYPFDGYNIRVEFPRSSSRGRGGGRMGGYGGGYGGGRFGGGGGGPRGSRPKGYQLMVSGLPPTGSWQDVKVRVYIMHVQLARCCIVDFHPCCKHILTNYLMYIKNQHPLSYGWFILSVYVKVLS